MLRYIDKKLNVVTMYRLTLYYLICLFAYACILGYLGIIPYSSLSLAISVVYIGFFCWITNLIFAKVFNVPANVESFYITALILVFIITPIKSFSDFTFFSIAAWAPILAMASKYILAIRKKHIFNPVAVSVVLTAFVLGISASWWVGTPWMIIPTVLGGFLITRKIIRGDMVWSFLIVATVTSIFSHNLDINSIVTTLDKLFVTSATIFFATVMLTEPLTTPPTKWFRILYGAIVGFLFVPSIHFGSLYLTPELALVFGNIFSYIFSPKEKLVLKLQEKNKIGDTTYDFIFKPDQKFSFVPGQYMEWTLPSNNSDNRGNRRYFTIASSPTESTVRVGVKTYENMSSYKSDLVSLSPGDMIIAGQRAGDFTLPKETDKKLVFIAGGIGITPFRSMLKYLVDKGEKRDIVLFYSNRISSDIIYRDVFDDAENNLGIRTIYTLTDKETIPQNWLGERGPITAAMIQKNIPDFADRQFFLSGPHGMVKSFEEILSNMGIRKSHVKTDFFPGFV